MRIAVPAEGSPGERRVAIVPEVVPLYTAAGLTVTVQSRAGAQALATDEAFAAAGAEVVDAVEAATVDVLLHVRPLHPAVVGKLRPGAVTIGLCAPATHLDTVRALRDGRITAFATDLVPQVARARSMDAAASQALVAGYRAVLEAATRLPRSFPPFWTSAGTLPPATVFVLGAGVAGLEAVATATRLGAVVRAHDPRPGSAEEIRSVGGVPVELDPRAGLGPHVAACDVLIAGPGTGPVTAEMMAAMKPGSVVVDLAPGAGGAVEGAEPGVELDLPVDGGTVRLVGLKDVESALPADASRLYARCVANLLLLMTKDGEVVPDLDDEVVGGSCLTHDGAVRHQPTAALLARRPRRGGGRG